LREEWAAAQAAAVTLAKAEKLDEAIAEVKRFHQHLCTVRVLDPACGTGNFLYVTLEHMKRLEGEVLTALEDFGQQQRELIEVDPHQLLGIEVNPRAAAIADLVLWIGHLQWHFRTRGDALPQEPVLKSFITSRTGTRCWLTTMSRS
jgi:SAM-dependent methyltransferase